MNETRGKPPVIFYWKWREEAIRGGNLERHLSNMIHRFSFDLLYVSYHHLRRAFDDVDLMATAARCRKKLAEHGRKLLLDVDIRREFDGFSRRYPGVDTYVTRFLEVELDENGAGELKVQDIVHQRSRDKLAPPDGDYVIRAWAFRETDGRCYEPSTLREITNDVRMTSKDLDGDGTWIKRIVVNAGRANGGKKALVFPAYRHLLPDPFSPQFSEYYSYLFTVAGRLDLDGVALDEYGYNVVIEGEEGSFFVQHYPYTPYLSKEYGNITGRALEDDLLHLAYAPSGNEGAALKVIDAYLQVLRDVMRRNNDWFYRTAKDTFGEETFVGVHPTFWGDPSDFTIDILLNGIDWWEVRRDYAQTDEMVVMPIRLALAHKWGGLVWYNMWYSQGSLVMDTYYRETWNNVRFGGRTHYLGYECPNEPGVFTLKHEGLLESLDRMERRVAKVNAFQQSQPDSRVLIVFGMEAVTNWRLNGHTDGRLLRNRGQLGKVLKFAESLFESGYLCDLVPSTEIANGDVSLVGGSARYGTQSFDAIIYLLPECIDRGVLQFLARYARRKGKLILHGRCTYFNDGRRATDEFAALLTGVEHYFADAMSTRDAMAILKKWNVPGNMPPGGCLYQDGSVIFTAPGVMENGNPLQVDCVVAGHRICFEGEDFLCLALGEEGRVARQASGSTGFLSVDGRPINEHG